MKEAVCPTDKTKNDTEAKAFQTFLVTATGFTAEELPDIISTVVMLLSPLPWVPSRLLPLPLPLSPPSHLSCE